MCPEYQSAWHDGLHHIMGKRGLDCSGAMNAAARWGGLPVTRTTARRMSEGEDGWDSILVPGGLNRAQELDLICWPRPAERHGHVGACHLGHQSRLLGIIHSSTRHKRVVEVPYGSTIKSDSPVVRRLTIGNIRHKDK